MIESAEEFVRLRCSDEPEEQWRASHEEASEAVWLDVIKQFPQKREWVAHNKAVPLSILRILATDPHERVRRTVARKRKLDRDLFDMLSQDDDAGVRLSVACNAKCPVELLRRLSEDPDECVAAAATERL